MSRGLLTLAKTALSMRGLPPLLVAVSIPGIPLYLTNWVKSLTIGSQVFTGAGPGKFVLSIDGLGENTKFEAPAASLQIKETAGTWHGYFWNNTLRGKRVTIAIYYFDTSGTLTATGYTATYVIDADQVDFEGVTMRLAAADAVTGTEYPKRTTQRHACEHAFMGPECGYRHPAGASSTLLTCDHGYNTPNGCVQHWPDLIDPVSGDAIIQPKPFSGPRSGLDHALVLGG